MQFSIVRCALQGHYRLVVAGGGTSGCAVASKFARLLPSHQRIAVVEPQSVHYYQPGLTLAAVGLMNFTQLKRDEKSVLPQNVGWIQSSLDALKPESNELSLKNGDSISYNFLVLATGIELRYEMIKGLPSGRQSILQSPSICSIYFPEGAQKTYEELNKFPAGGTALFTFPATPIKCAGAPQKICYLAEEIFRNRNVRSNSKVIYCTSLGQIFGVPRYAKALETIMKERNIELRTRLNLVEVRPESKLAIFEVLDESGKGSGKFEEFQYSLLHVGPPCSPVEALRNYAKVNGQRLTDPLGWIKVNPKTLQSENFPNVFAIGDCANTPNAKTAAAVSSQLKALSRNLRNVMANKQPKTEYDGYASCPLVVDRKHVVLAEFSPSGPMETFPFDQSKPTRISYWMKRYLMPSLYWNFLLKGYWEGPATIRRMIGKKQ